MGSECNPCKRHYDLSMSKRTRKPSLLQGVDRPPMTIERPDSSPGDPILKDTNERQDSTPIVCKTSLKELFSWEEETKMDNEKEEVKLIVCNGEAKHGQGKNSLGHHFKEEGKHLHLLKKQQEEGLEKVKLNGSVSCCAKILSRLIKINKQDHPRFGSAKKPVLRLTMLGSK